MTTQLVQQLSKYQGESQRTGSGSPAMMNQKDGEAPAVEGAGLTGQGFGGGGGFGAASANPQAGAGAGGVTDPPWPPALPGGSG